MEYCEVAWPFIERLLLNWVVAGKGDETSPAYAERIKDLRPCIQPGRGLHQLVHLQERHSAKLIWASLSFAISNHQCWQSKTYVRCEEEFHSTQSPFESQSSDQEDSQYDVWKDCCNIHGLRKDIHWFTENSAPKNAWKVYIFSLALATSNDTMHWYDCWDFASLLHVT